jgi:2-polyprenyl-6-methoxyphenol hydroxylase-like FAD-dependent oxidoreductase
MTHKQPALEKALREAADPQFRVLRLGSTVIDISEDDQNVYVTYENIDKTTQHVRGKFLVGADGKTGFVRKRYLEPKGVIMENNPK